MRDAVSGLLWWRQNCSNTNNSGQSSLEISRANFRRVYVAHRGFSIKVDQSNRHSVTQQSEGSFSHQTLPQDVNIAKLALQLNGSIGSGSLDNRSHPHCIVLHCDDEHVDHLQGQATATR